MFAKFLRHFRESLEKKKTKDMFLGHSGRFSYVFIRFQYVNAAICDDNQKILKSKISRRMVSKTPFESPVRSTVKGSIG